MLKGKSVAVTGAAGGIGLAIAQMFLKEGANVAISDLSAPVDIAKGIGASAFACDVSDETAVQDFIKGAEAKNGPIDIFISNAGVGFGDPAHAADATNAQWEMSWQINVMSSVYAARVLLPGWIERGSGRFVITASAAGLLNQIGSASYSTTKHAAVGFAESLAIQHKSDGIAVHCICPQYVRTNMTKGHKFAENNKDGFLEPSDVANVLKTAIETNQFLVLSHPIVKDYFYNKAADYQTYIDGMAYLKSKVAKEDLPL